MQDIPKISLQTILLPFLPSYNLSYHYTPPILRPIPLLYFHAPLTLSNLHQKSVLFLIPLALPYSHLISTTSSLKYKLRKDNTDFFPSLLFFSFPLDYLSAALKPRPGPVRGTPDPSHLKFDFVCLQRRNQCQAFFVELQAENLL